MKKIVRLSESDMVRLVKRVIKEDEMEMMGKSPMGRKMSKNAPEYVVLHGASSDEVQIALEGLSEDIGFITFYNCEYADFSNIDLCSFNKLTFVNLLGTPNNLKEHTDCDYEELSDGMFDFVGTDR